MYPPEWYIAAILGQKANHMLVIPVKMWGGMIAMVVIWLICYVLHVLYTKFLFTPTSQNEYWWLDTDWINQWAWNLLSISLPMKMQRKNNNIENRYILSTERQVVGETRFSDYCRISNGSLFPWHSCRSEGIGWIEAMVKAPFCPLVGWVKMSMYISFSCPIISGPQE